jgi:hypothetical protein
MLFESIFRYETLAWHVRAARRNARAWGGEPLEGPTSGIPGSTLMLMRLVEHLPLDEPVASYAPVAFAQRANGMWAAVERAEMDRVAARRDMERQTN